MPRLSSAIRLTLSLKLHTLVRVACSIKSIDLVADRSMMKNVNKELVMLATPGTLDRMTLKAVEVILGTKLNFSDIAKFVPIERDKFDDTELK